MKKSLLLTCLICGALLLSACGASPADAASSGGGFSGNGFAGGSARQSGIAGIFSIFSSRPSVTFTPEEKLAVGTVKLDANSKSIDRAEAEKLLPLWQLLHQLYTSSSAASEEKAAVVDAIRNAMTPEQVAAIDSMQMSRADLFAAFQQGQNGGSNGAAAGTGGTRTQNFTGGNGTRRSGGGGQGFFFAGGPGGFDGGGVRTGAAGASGGTGATTTTQQSLNSAQRAQVAANNLTGALISQVITLLQDKLSS